MDRLDILLWGMVSGFALTFGLLLIMWNSMNQRFGALIARLDKLDEKLTHSKS